MYTSGLLDERLRESGGEYAMCMYFGEAGIVDCVFKFINV